MFRPIVRSDREQFLVLAEEFYHSDAVLHPVPVEYHQRTFDEMAQSNCYLEGYFFQVEGALAGYALLSRSFSPEVGGQILWVEEVYIRKEYRGCGLGGAFFTFLRERYDDVICRYRLEVERDNDRAIALYERLGYERLPYVQMILDVEKES